VRILYGVVGEGMGHATRSSVLLSHLTQNHEVHVVVSGRARDYLAQRFANVHKIWGLTIQYEGNSVRTLGTIVENLRGALRGLPANIRAYFDLIDEFHPELVISDFETFSYLYGRNHRLPVLSVDNMQVINRCQHAPEILAGYERQFELARAFVKSKLPGCRHYLVTSFFHPPLRRKRTTLVPPILRQEILAARREAGEHLLVYQTATTNTELTDALLASGYPCRIYGVRRGIQHDEVEANLTFRPFSESAFIDDLRTARAVIAGGGFTLLSEAVYLGKPILSLPVQGQFEQILNARYLQQLGYGHFAQALDGPTIDAFLRDVPHCAERLASYAQDGNRLLLEELDRLLDRASAGLR
jgi:uncharacterized protein (TIGR00661 family)